MQESIKTINLSITFVLCVETLDNFKKPAKNTIICMWKRYVTASTSLLYVETGISDVPSLLKLIFGGKSTIRVLCCLSLYLPNREVRH